MLRDYGCIEAASVMDRWAKLCGRYMGIHRGFSIGISDVTPSDALTSMKHDILLEGYKEVCELSILAGSLVVPCLTYSMQTMMKV